MHQGRNLRIIGLVDLDGPAAALSPGRRARTGICNKAATSSAASSLSSGSHRFIVGGWSVCLTQSAGRYLESGCRAGWQTREMRAISDATIWSMAKAQAGLLPDTAPCAVPRQRCSQFFAVPAVSLAINPKVFGHAERDAVQRAYAVREVWAGMLLASSI